MNMITQTGTMTIVQLSTLIHDDGSRYFTVTTCDDATGGHEVTGLAHAEYEKLFRLLYIQRGVVLTTPDKSATWHVGYISGLAREHAAWILPAVIDREPAVEYADVLPERMP